MNPIITLHRPPFFLSVNVTTAGVLLGLAKAAAEVFLERLPGRTIAYTDYASQQEAPITHLQVGTAAMQIGEAEFRARHAATVVDRKAVIAEPWTISERVQVRLDVSATCLRAKDAIDILATASGASSIYYDVPIQRIDRDIRAAHQHASLHPNTAIELYGRVICGLEPNTTNL
ncbi:hypothetical protein GZH49_37580 [Nocardia terpenica]|uniref:hypothetical protein n=1 Tax=Nocardia terpenica TaxID=455432 RepID=UPI003A5BACDA